MKRKALGKGLDALLPSMPDEGNPSKVDIDLLFPNERQPRINFSVQALDELSASIQENGIVQPIVVRRRGERFEIVAGERRWRAAQKAGLLKVPVVVMDVPDERMLELAVLENIQREDLNPMEEARAYNLLLEEKQIRQEDLARRLGKARTTITNSLRLLQFPERIQQFLEERTLTAGQARPLLSVTDKTLQVKLAEAVAQRGLSAREVEKLVTRIQQEKPARPKAQRQDPHILAAEEKLCEKMGARVRIKGSQAGGGQIVIHFTSEDELERLYETLCQVK